MRNAGFVVLIGSVALAGLMFVFWLLGFVLGFTLGGLIHLLLALAILIAPVGIVVGVLLIFLGGRNRTR